MQIALCLLQIHSWKKWEEEAAAQENQTENGESPGPCSGCRICAAAERASLTCLTSPAAMPACHGVRVTSADVLREHSALVLVSCSKEDEQAIHVRSSTYVAAMEQQPCDALDCEYPTPQAPTGPNPRS